MKRAFALFVMLVSILLLSFSFPGTEETGASEDPTPPVSQTAVMPSGDGCYLGIFREGAPVNMEFIKAFEKTMEKKPAMVMWYLDYSNAFPRREIEKVDAYGAVSQIVWEPWIWGEEDSIKLADIKAGKYDEYIRGWAKNAKEFGKPLFIRWGHEFNIKKYSWGVPANGGKPERYIEAYRHVHDIFKAQGATNVKWIWCFNNYPEPDAVWNEWEKAYPGDDYVDWIGIDGYNWGTSQPWSGWETFEVLFRNQVRETARKHPTKPIMIAEFGSAEDENDENAKARWIKAIPDSLKISMKQVKAIVLFDVRKECDWRSNSCKATENAYKQILKDPYFLSDIKGIADLRVERASVAIKKTMAKKTKKPLKIDGLLDDWADAQPMILDSRELLKEGTAWNGVKDASGKIYLKWDADYFYLAADITDDMPLSNSRKDGDVWNGDAIEVMLSTDPELSQDRQYLSNKDFQIGFGTGDGRSNLPSIWIWQKRRSPQGGEIKVIRKVDVPGYVLEAKVPWSELGAFRPKAGTGVGFDIALDDADIKFEREAQLIWSGDFLFYKDPSVWGKLQFID